MYYRWAPSEEDNTVLGTYSVIEGVESPPDSIRDMLVEIDHE